MKDDYSDKKDKEIVSLVLKNRHIFIEIIKRYENRLSRYIKRLGSFTKEDIEDILQNIFIKTYKNLNNFDSDLSFSSWIYRIAHNEAISFFRSRNVRPEGNLVSDSEKALSLIYDNSDIFEESNQKINSEYLQKAISKIDIKYRDVIILKYFENYEYSEISDILQVPEGSVATLLHRAKKKLHNELSHINIK